MTNLTDRELQVLSLLCEGMQVKEVARALAIGPRRVKHIREILGIKFNVHTTPQLIVAAFKKGVIKCN